MQENKLADGNLFEFWEKDVNYIHTLDILGNERQAGGVVPGPFAELEFDKVYSIDPRK
ncbi:MAG: hypothetical protein K6A45_04695 [Lachnospiraceae bacterium]|nr:hypothetical protein [Lachnospiraceae bacterium]